MRPIQRSNAVDKHLYSVSAEEKYYFDLRGYLVVRNALTAEELSECNAAIDHWGIIYLTFLESATQRPLLSFKQGLHTCSARVPDAVELNHRNDTPMANLLLALACNEHATG